MCWTDLLLLSRRISTFACLITLFGQCKIDSINSVDKLPSESLTLLKGQYLADPVVQTSPSTIATVVTLNNLYDRRMAGLTKESRPTSTNSYSTSLVESIKKADLPNHVFQWQSTKQPVMMVALFNQVVQVAGDEISNKEALVWLWTPPKGSVDPGVITYKDGQTAEWDKATGNYKLLKATSLPVGGPRFVWCVLAWDKQGINIIAASRELPIQITE